MTAVTFDLWHTLLYLDPDDEEEYYRTQLAVAEEALRDGAPVRGAPEPVASDLTSAFERVFAEAVRASVEGRTIAPAEHILIAGRRVGRSPDPLRYVRRLGEAVEAQPFRTAPGAVQLLDELSGMGYRLGLISNTVGERGAALRRVLERRGLARFFTTTVFSDELPWAKPAPEIFWTAIDGLGDTPEKTVHVGDGWADLEGSRRAGLRSGLHYTGLSRYGATYRALHPLPSPRLATPEEAISDLAEVVPIVTRLLPVAAGRR